MALEDGSLSETDGSHLLEYTQSQVTQMSSLADTEGADVDLSREPILSWSHPNFTGAHSLSLMRGMPHFVTQWRAPDALILSLFLHHCCLAISLSALQASRYPRGEAMRHVSSATC